ncbi:MAG: hypothetical protein KGI05_00790 [Thaumarchaeota archaeon]|nr:hypothetical protein [Nitrososphaerota archaeon]
MDVLQKAFGKKLTQSMEYLQYFMLYYVLPVEKIGTTRTLRDIAKAGNVRRGDLVATTLRW